MDDSKKKVHVHYIQSNGYRVVHADGAHGGGTPRGKIIISFHSERLPIPEMVVHELEGNHLSDELVEERQSKKGVVREVEVGVMMDLSVAKDLHSWFGSKILELGEAMGGANP